MELRQPSRNLQNPTQMLSYNRLHFISFLSWSLEGAWSKWQVPLVLPFEEEEVGVQTSPLASSPAQVLLMKDLV